MTLALAIYFGFVLTFLFGFTMAAAFSQGRD
jgi:hypothetical protein